MGEIVEMGSAKHRWWKEAVVYQVPLPIKQSSLESSLMSPLGLPGIISVHRFR